ncbi:hypothetical protein BABINDRAFT_160067 [Babjeviella inositovora NRRL Y-12698]|uniref:Uncharacterized protein n=1 Tax=Babjeviella inositovora NRRL Y-12698 TaxID=984486 RepID=A0A1E3QVY7_9ASCO|nr:uncharacterized protein BABINDRAFT_160067 [Babjeviella inositovora NRRL Y-12698]ODQ81836.1 hypothetical protein BABINDRAFT_160067 [Babjeviella inositovora NRRL Y-12698]
MKRLVPIPTRTVLPRFQDLVVPPDEYIRHQFLATSPSNKAATASKLFKEQYITKESRPKTLALDPKLFSPMMREVLKPLYASALADRVSAKLLNDDQSWNFVQDLRLRHVPYPKTLAEKRRRMASNPGSYGLDGPDQLVVGRYINILNDYPVVIVLQHTGKLTTDISWLKLLGELDTTVYHAEKIEDLLFARANQEITSLEDPFSLYLVERSTEEPEFTPKQYIIAVSQTTLSDTSPSQLHTLLDKYRVDVSVVCARLLLNNDAIKSEILATIGGSSEKGEFMKQAMERTRTRRLTEQTGAAGGMGKWLIMLAEKGLLRVTDSTTKDGSECSYLFKE